MENWLAMGLRFVQIGYFVGGKLDIKDGIIGGSGICSVL